MILTRQRNCRQQKQNEKTLIAASLHESNQQV